MSDGNVEHPQPSAPSLVAFAERDRERESTLDRKFRDICGLARHVLRRTSVPRADAMTRAAALAEPGLLDLDDQRLDEAIVEMKTRLALGGSASEPEGRDMALLREVSRRVLGLRPHDVQLMAACVVMSGRIAEMATGEGKTLVAALAAAWRALSGTRVHVVTVNDYLAARDARVMSGFYARLGLRVGIVTQESSPEQRIAAYRAPLCYCTNKELAFDYLRQSASGLLRDAPLQRRLINLTNNNRPESTNAASAAMLPGLEFAILDEADSVLIDEARTPLILSKKGDMYLAADVLERVMTHAQTLKPGVDIRVDPARWSVDISDPALNLLHRGFHHETRGPLSIPRLREELLRQALMALHLYRVGEHYLVREGKVGIIDEYTGRIMPDRSWRGGLHQMIELKEGVALTAPLETHASMTYQRFFRRYVMLSGMSGTVREVASELWNVYELEVQSVPTHMPVRRRELSDRIYSSETAKWTAIQDHVAELHARGVPVLIGCRTVAGSRRASDMLTQAGLVHKVLNADETAREADIIAVAGQRGSITVATNMAGRGTDIALGEGIAELGGLHVVMTERHDSRRIDRQLAGRCARQGEPGVFVAMLSIEDRLYGYLRPRSLAWIFQLAVRFWPSLVGKALIRLAQLQLERRHSRIRKDLLHTDRIQGDLMALSGTLE
ncbi:hypothetical protein [Halomonas sp.]|uniref:preprotein translocase subunit SecA n=1 Tax=Halomonas sp. TaxID=1486246 RepID=UPI00384A56EC